MLVYGMTALILGVAPVLVQTSIFVGTDVYGHEPSRNTYVHMLCPVLIVILHLAGYRPGRCRIALLAFKSSTVQ